MNKQVNIGLIGFGIGGQIFHAPFISGIDGFILKTIRCTNPAHVLLAEQQYPGTEIVPDSEMIINDPAINLVVITTPNTLHYPLAKAA